MDPFKHHEKINPKCQDLAQATPAVAVKAERHWPLPDTMSPKAAAAYLGIATTTLAMWRSTKRYALSYIKVGRLVQYRKSDLDAFLSSRTVNVSE